MRFWQNIQQSLKAILANKFRAGVTIFIIALGITALVVVMTAIAGIRSGMTSSFASLGTNTFYVTNQKAQVRFAGRGRDRQPIPEITFREAVEFQEAFREQAVVSLQLSVGGTFRLKSQREETNPNINLTASDAYYLQTAQYELAAGRNLTEDDVQQARNVIILGGEVRETLFPFGPAVGEYVTVQGNSYRVIGTLAKIGTMGMGGIDRTCLIPITTGRSHYPGNRSVSISVVSPNPNLINDLMAEAQGTFRIIRGLGPREADNFFLSRADQFVDQLLEQASVLTLAAQVIAIITLLGAGVALLNVMLVSVTERTREIGMRKATGASRRDIQVQFLWEAIVICQIGALLGILLGILGGNLVSSLAFSSGFVVPWAWVWIGIIACLFVGVGAGLYPANKAAKVDPIESLRHV